MELVGLPSNFDHGGFLNLEYVCTLAVGGWRRGFNLGFFLFLNDLKHHGGVFIFFFQD